MRRSRQAFEEQLEQLLQRLLQMGAFVEAMLQKAIRALADHDVALAREVISADDVADEMDLEIHGTDSGAGTAIGATLTGTAGNILRGDEVYGIAGAGQGRQVIELGNALQGTADNDGLGRVVGETGEFQN